MLHFIIFQAWSVVTNWLNPSNYCINQESNEGCLLFIIIDLYNDNSLNLFYFTIIVPEDVKESLQILIQTPLAKRLVEWYLGNIINLYTYI